MQDSNKFLVLVQSSLVRIVFLGVWGAYPGIGQGSEDEDDILLVAIYRQNSSLSRNVGVVPYQQIVLMGWELLIMKSRRITSLFSVLSLSHTGRGGEGRRTREYQPHVTPPPPPKSPLFSYLLHTLRRFSSLISRHDDIEMNNCLNFLFAKVPLT